MLTITFFSFFAKNIRFVAATCDPKDFASEGYTLRQQLLGRETELFIVLTMYNVRFCWICIFCTSILNIQ